MERLPISTGACRRLPVGHPPIDCHQLSTSCRLQHARLSCTVLSRKQKYRGGVFRAGENMNLQILAQQNLCHFLKMSEQIMYVSQ